MKENQNHPQNLITTDADFVPANYVKKQLSSLMSPPNSSHLHVPSDLQLRYNNNFLQILCNIGSSYVCSNRSVQHCLVCSVQTGWPSIRHGRPACFCHASLAGRADAKEIQRRGLVKACRPWQPRPDLCQAGLLIF